MLENENIVVLRSFIYCRHLNGNDMYINNITSIILVYFSYHLAYLKIFDMDMISKVF